MLKGKVEYTVGEEKYILEEGDSIYFDATAAHNPKNLGETAAQMLVIYIFNAPK